MSTSSTSSTAHRPAFAARAGQSRLPEFEVLDQAHKAVLVMLDAFEQLVAHLNDQGLDDTARQGARDILGFFNGPGRSHHADEETHVFPGLLASRPGKTWVSSSAWWLRPGPLKKPRMSRAPWRAVSSRPWSLRWATSCSKASSMTSTALWAWSSTSNSGSRDWPARAANAGRWAVELVEDVDMGPPGRAPTVAPPGGSRLAFDQAGGPPFASWPQR